MLFRIFSPVATLSLSLGLVAAIHAADPQPYSCAGPVDDAFVSGVWAKVVSQECLKCHKEGGDAEDSDFILRDPTKALGEARDQAMRHNLAAFVQMAREIKDGESRLLLKAEGRTKHGGKEVIKKGSPESRLLADYIQHVTAPASANAVRAREAEKNLPPFFDGIVMLDDARLLRRATLSLAGRLPTAEELATVKRDGVKAVPGLLDAVMKEEAFYDRIREGFNDIFLTIGADGNPDQNVLSYDHFPTRQWYAKYDLSHIADEKERKKAGYKLTDDYRDALRGEPMKLVEHIVRHDRPFTEIVTADYIMVSPYTSRGYGIFEEIKAQFKNLEDPFEYIPVKIKALKGRNKQQDQESATGFYPHAGLLSTFQYLCRYPTTETNRNRLRARMYYQHFLGVDVLELAARVTDAAAVTAKYKVPTMEASECVVCHKTLDPVASLFQDYWRFAAEGIYGKRKGGWFEDMFQAGFEGEDMPAPERWRALQWLGEHTAKDPRFATAMVEHAIYILTGRKALLPPKGLDDPLYDAKHRAYLAQRKQIEAIAARFAQNGFDFKNMLKDWIVSDFYRADGLASAVANPSRRAELDDIGIVRMLAPEQVERKLNAVFGRRWGKLEGQLAMLYGGIDSKEVTERATDPSGAMGAIQRIMSNDVACKEVAFDLSRPSAERRLFTTVETDMLPGASTEDDAKIRATIAHLHALVLGRDDKADSPEVERTFRLFADIVGDATQNKHAADEIYSCRYDRNIVVPDPKYTLRAWRAVVTYLLRRNEFLYE
jgi:hypothetical protein